ncbi:disks large-associated protein 5 [Cydia strobilella]|uniref:disks large-associated protein 5 n=1 Tax=Cydia strobilella TaxID=1100964 RepID=UPI003003D281
MDTSFDLVALLKQRPSTKKSYKKRPTHFVSAAGGVQKRLETNIKNRRSSRFSVFDRIRNITICDSPKAPNQQKPLQRKQQLEKWKEEKNKKKREAAAQKKKPFVSAVSQRKTFGPPPPPPKPMPSTSGRVTRSQARQKTESKTSNAQTTSFAPSNAGFKPSIFLNTEVPTLAPIYKSKTSKTKPNITFEPVLPKKLQKETSTTRTTRARLVPNKPEVDNKKKPNGKTKAKMPVTPPPLKQQMFQSSSSSSDMEQPSLQKTITKTQEKLVLMAQASTSQDSACDLQETASMSSEESQVSSQDSQDALISIDSSLSQDIASMSSHDELSTPRNKVPKSESSSEEKLRSPQAVHMALTPEQIAEEVKNISPCVTLSRGKNNARKEMKKKLEEGLLDEDNSNMESVNHFRRQLNSEIARLTAMCNTWDKVYAQTVLPEPIQELVLAAVGQTRLLMSHKLQQFAVLVENCEHPIPGATVVTPADLHGFWDMVFMQVEDVDMRFKRLEELQLRNWIEEQKPEVKKVVAKPAAKKVAAKPTAGPSRLREMIAAAIKAKKDQESQSENSTEESEPTASPETKIFEAGFFRISSPMKQGSPALGTPNNKASLLKTVLSSEAKKSVIKNSTSFAMLRASLMSKNVDIEGVSPLMQTPTISPALPSSATPARSILKKNPDSKKPDIRKAVLFNDEPSSPTFSQPAFSFSSSSPTSYTSCEKTEAEDPGIAPLPADDKENTATPKQASSRKSRISRQNAIEQSSPDMTHNLVVYRSPIMTRSRRKSAQTPLVQTETEKNRTTRKSAQTPLVASDTNVEIKLSRRKSAQTPLVASDTNVEIKNSTRKSAQTPLVASDTNVEIKLSTRKSAQTPLVAPDTNVEIKLSTRKSAQTPLVAPDTNVEIKLSTRKSAQTPLVASDTNVEIKLSARKSAQTPLVAPDTNVEEVQAQETETPKRSTRKRKSALAV